MKRIKTVNGYAIYEATSARDEANYNCGIGHYNLYLSSDIKDFGLSNSYPDYEDVDSMAVAIAYANGSHFAVATSLAWELTDSTVEDVALRDEIERRLEAGQPINYIRECYDTDEQRFDPELDWMERTAQHSDSGAEEEAALMDFELSGLEPGDYLMSPSGDGIVRILSIDRSGTFPSFEVEYPNGTIGHLGAYHVSRMTGVSRDSFRELRERAAALWESQAPKPCDLLDDEPEEDEPEYSHVEPISRDRKADLFDHLLDRIIDDHDCDSSYLVDILRGCSFSDDEIRAVLPWLEDLVDLAPVGLDRGGATPRDVEYSDGSFGVEQPRWRVYYEGEVFPEDHYERGSVGITREYWDGDKARKLRDYCEKHHVPVWLDDTYYGVTEHDGDCY